jgi:transposase
MRSDDLSAAEYELLARIAHRYYTDGRTQEEIAREFGLCRPKVQRLLERARWSGVVDIRIAAPPWLNLDLATRLREEFRPPGEFQAGWMALQERHGCRDLRSRLGRRHSGGLLSNATQ